MKNKNFTTKKCWHVFLLKLYLFFLTKFAVIRQFCPELPDIRCIPRSRSSLADHDWWCLCSNRNIPSLIFIVLSFIFLSVSKFLFFLSFSHFFNTSSLFFNLSSFSVLYGPSYKKYNLFLWISVAFFLSRILLILHVVDLVSFSSLSFLISLSLSRSSWWY